MKIFVKGVHTNIQNAESSGKFYSISFHSFLHLTNALVERLTSCKEVKPLNEDQCAVDVKSLFDFFVEKVKLLN